jgi:hypothetical protein
MRTEKFEKSMHDLNISKETTMATTADTQLVLHTLAT